MIVIWILGFGLSLREKDWGSALLCLVVPPWSALVLLVEILES